jgi:hypothetical protein
MIKIPSNGSARDESLAMLAVAALYSTSRPDAPSLIVCFCDNSCQPSLGAF